MQTHRVACNKIASDTKKRLGGAKYKVYDSKGKKVYEFTTGKKAEFIEGMFKAGETYTFKEVDAPEHYKVAKDKKIRTQERFRNLQLQMKESLWYPTHHRQALMERQQEWWFHLLRYCLHLDVLHA